MYKPKLSRAMAMLMTVVMLLSAVMAGGILPSSNQVVNAEAIAFQTDEYVRIKNKWTGNYLYEDESAVIRYGFTSATDESSHWIIEEGSNQAVTIRNKATGRYISMADVEARESMLTSETAAATIDTAWIVEPAVNREGQYTIRSAKFAGGNYFIHQEDQLGYAQVSGDIGAEWESPQWSFEAAPSEQAVRIYNKYRQAYLYEVTEAGDDQGKVQYGQPHYSDARSHWYVDEVSNAEGKKIVELRNALTGHVITQGTFWAQIEAKAPAASQKSQWIMAATSDEQFVTFTNVFALESTESEPDDIPQGNYVLNTQFEDIYARSNDWSHAANDNAQWRIEIAPVVQPVRLVNYRDIGDESSKVYLYEDQAEVKYGALEASNAAYQWVIEDYNGNKRIRNLWSGSYMSAANIVEAADPLEALDEANAGEWTFNESNLYDNFVSIENSKEAGQYIHIAGETGSAQAGEISPTVSEAQWYLEDSSVSGGGEPQIVQIRNVWNSMYLYEDENHVLKYGNASAGDERAQWVVTRYHGRNLIQNRATGHYLNLLHQTTGHIPLSEIDIEQLSEDELEEVLWRIKDNGGAKNIWSARDLNNVPGQQSYLNLQNLTKYVEYSTINPNWGSPKWQFINVAEDAEQYVRIRSKTTDQYLYEEAEIVMYGNPSESDFNSHWIMEEGDGGRKVIRNRATGHYLSMQPSGADEAEIEITTVAVRSIAAEPSWASHKWILEEDGDYKAFKSGWTNDHYLTTRDDLGYLQRIRSAQLTDEEAEESKWFAFEPAPNMSPYVRIKNKDSNQYWYEEDKQLKYGDLDIADSRTHWFLEDAGDGAQYVRNRATGHYINIEFMNRDDASSPISVEHFEMEWGSASPKWFVEDAASAGYVRFRNLWNDWRYLSVRDELGHVQQIEHAEADDDSAQFMMEGVPAGQLLLPTEPIRIKNVLNDQYLVQTGQNIVVYGNPETNNAFSHWIIESADGIQRIKNRATGRYISLTPDYRYVETIQDGEAPQTQWIIEGAPIGDAYLLRSNVSGYSDEYLHTLSSVGYPERGLQLISNPGLHWMFETAPEDGETPAIDEEPSSGTVSVIHNDSNVVQLINQSTGQLLLVEDNTVAFIDASNAENDARAQWLVQDYNGHKLLKNNATNQLLYASESGISLLTVTAGTAKAAIETGAQWKLHQILGYHKLESAANAGELLRQQGEQAVLGAANDAASNWTLEPVAGDVRYEAELAFVAGGAKTKVGSAGLPAKEGVATGFAENGARIIMAVNGQAANEYEAVIRYSNPSAVAQTLSLKVNGIEAEQLQFNTTGRGVWQDLAVVLPLRAGYNSLTIERTGIDTGTGQVEIDAVIVRDNVNLAYRGATLSYITYEAEHMNTNGNLIGPSRVYLDVASEASGRQAVRLDQTGHFVEFQAAKDANAMVVRYSIPDALKGDGIEATLGVYIDGEFRTELTLNSQYAWVYGNYPWSNDPKQGSAHRFFDDAQALIGDIPAGSTVRLEVRENDVADYYIIDLVDLELAPDAYEMPDGYLSVTDFGAIANDELDDTAAFNAAMEAAKEEGKGVWFPAGTFEVGDGLLILDNITIRGAGMWYTKLNEAKFFGNGSDIQVYDLMIDGKISVRDDEAQTNGFEGAFGPGSTVQHVWIEHTKTGLWLTRPINKFGYEFNTDLSTNEFYIAGSRIRNVMADGINFSVNTKNSMAEHMNIRYSGDDGMAMWSFVENVPTDFTENNTYRFNTVQLPWLANNMIIFGGKNHKLQDNIVMDTVTHGAGISVSTKFTPTPYEGTIIVERNTLIRTGSHDAGAGYNTGAIWIYAYDRDIDTEVIIRQNTALDSTYHGLSVDGGRLLGSVNAKKAKVTVEDMIIDGAGLTGVQISSTIKGAINFKNVAITNTKLGSIHNGAGASFKIHQLTDGNEQTPSTPRNPEVNEPQELEPSPGSAQENDEKLKAGTENQQAMIELSVNAQGVAELSAATLLEAAEGHPNGSIVVGVNQASYILPLQIAEWIRQQLTENESAPAKLDGTLVMKIAEASVQQQSEISAQAQSSELRLAGKPIQFQLWLKQGEQQVDLSNLGRNYMKHMITLDEKLDSSNATALAYDPETKELRYVPALFSTQGNQTVVTILSPSSGIFIIAEGYKSFSDVQGHWAKEEIEQLASKRIVFGKSAEAFKPQDSITRAEFTALLIRALGLRNSGSSLSFADIEPSDWFYSEVTVAAQYGLVSGVGQDRFNPNDTITREQMAVILANALGISNLGSDASNMFRDQADISAWARAAVDQIAELGLMNGQLGQRFAPKNEATRAEAVIVLGRLLKHMELMNK